MGVPEDVRGLGSPVPSALSWPYRLAEVIREAARQEVLRAGRLFVAGGISKSSDEPTEILLTYREDGRLHEATTQGWRWTIDYLSDIGEAGQRRGIAQVTEERPDGRVVVWDFEYDSAGRLVRATPTVLADEVEEEEL